MRPRTWMLAPIVLVAMTTPPAAADEPDCPPQPLTNEIKQHYSGGLIVEFLRLFGPKVGFKGEVDLSDNDALVKYPDADLFALSLSYLSTQCRKVFNSSLPLSDQIDKYERIYLRVMEMEKSFKKA